MVENYHLRLCLVTKIFPFDFYKKLILDAIEGGITIVQLRDKSLNIEKLKSLAFELKGLLNHYQIPLIINDHVEIAQEIDADGVHLGRTDLSPLDARKLLGPKKIIGLSIESEEELTIANQLTCIDYIAASAVFPSNSKLNCKKIWGLNGLQKITQQSKHPVIAIGGINQNNVRSVIEKGASGIAVIEAIHRQDDTRKAAHNLITTINQTMEANKYVAAIARKNNCDQR